MASWFCEYLLRDLLRSCREGRSAEELEKVADPRFEGEERAAAGKEHSAVNEGVEESP